MDELIDYLCYNVVASIWMNANFSFSCYLLISLYFLLIVLLDFDYHFDRGRSIRDSLYSKYYFLCLNPQFIVSIL